MYAGAERYVPITLFKFCESLSRTYFITALWTAYRSDVPKSCLRAGIADHWPIYCGLWAFKFCRSTCFAIIPVASVKSKGGRRNKCSVIFIGNSLIIDWLQRGHTAELGKANAKYEYASPLHDSCSHCATCSEIYEDKSNSALRTLIPRDGAFKFQVVPLTCLKHQHQLQKWRR